MDQVLENGTGNTSLPDSIRVALALARRTLNRYYGKTDLSVAYRVSMCAYIYLLPVHTSNAHMPLVLHPEYKTAYWKEAGWPSDWIAEGIRLLREIYRRDYADLPLTSEELPRSKPIVCLVCLPLIILMLTVYWPMNRQNRRSHSWLISRKT